MKDKIKQKIKELNKEVTSLVKTKEELRSQESEVDVHITQLVGAIKVLNDLINN